MSTKRMLNNAKPFGKVSTTVEKFCDSRLLQTFPGREDDNLDYAGVRRPKSYERRMFVQV